MPHYAVLCDVSFHTVTDIILWVKNKLSWRVKTDIEIVYTLILSLHPIQEGQLSVSY